jgi:hypothetical protein
MAKPYAGSVSELIESTDGPIIPGATISIIVEVDVENLKMSRIVPNTLSKSQRIILLDQTERRVHQKKDVARLK